MAGRVVCDPAAPAEAPRRLELQPAHDLVIAPGVAAGLVAELQRSSTSLQHLHFWNNDSLWEQLVRGERAQESGFLAAIAALQQLTSLKIWNNGASYHVLPPASTVLPTSLEWLVYGCGELPRQIAQLTRQEHLELGRYCIPLPASLAVLPSLRGLNVGCREFPAQLAHLTRLEELEIHGRMAMCEANQHVTALVRLTRVRMVGLLAGGRCTHTVLTCSLLSALAAHVADNLYGRFQGPAPQLDRAGQPAQAGARQPWPTGCRGRAATAGHLDAAHVAAH